MVRKRKLPISVVMIIYNEEETLERAITSIVNSVDELIIIHDGPCRDNSVRIAKKYTKNVFVLPHKGACEYHRVFGYTKAKNDWIMHLDGDEYVSTGLRSKLPSLIKQNVDIFEVLWPTQHKCTHYLANYKRALFRKSKSYYIAAMHEFVKPTTTASIVAKVDEPIYNAPAYENMSMKVFIKKWLPWAKMHARDLATPFDKLQKWNCPLTDWETTTKIRIQHPLLLGIAGSVAYHILYNLKSAIEKRSSYFVVQGYYKALYFISVYYFLYRLQHEKNI